MTGFVASALTWMWARWRLFLGHIAITLVACFMLFFVNGRQFFLTRQLSLKQADGSTTREIVFLPVQSDITTLISLFASAARVVSTLWVVGIDLRCAMLFMERGGVTFKGLKSLIGGSLPGRRQFLWTTNYIILVTLQVAILTSSFTASVVSGSVTWEPAQKHMPGRPITTIPLGQSGDPVYATASSTLLDTLIGYTTTIYSIFYDDTKNRYSTSMHRLLPESVGSLPIGSTFEELTVPYFSVDAFEWIKDPIATLSSHQLNAVTLVNVTGPRVMTIRKWGLIPDENWGPSEGAFPAPLTISESRILVMSGLPLRTDSSKCNLGRLGSTIPADVQSYMATLKNMSSCFIFANVTYRAGAARSRRCQLLGTRVVQDVGDVRDLPLVEDSVTSVALGLAPYVSTSIFDMGYAIPFNSGKLSTMQTVSIEFLSRSYQVAWNALIASYGASKLESVNVSIAVDAPRAAVLMWRVVVWSMMHAMLVALGFMFRHIHTSGQHPWIEDPVIAALLVDPTPIMNDPEMRADEDAPLMAAQLKLNKRNNRKYVVLEREKNLESDPEEEE